MIDVSRTAADAGYGQGLPKKEERHEGGIRVQVTDHLVRLDVPHALSRLFVIGKLMEFIAGGHRILGRPTSVTRRKDAPGRWWVLIDPEWVKAAEDGDDG